MPAVLGEADVLKSLHFLPGVNPGQEGLTSFSVRGGSPDNTQFLLDGLPVYNVNHAYGYFPLLMEMPCKMLRFTRVIFPLVTGVACPPCWK